MRTTFFLFISWLIISGTFAQGDIIFCDDFESPQFDPKWMPRPGLEGSNGRVDIVFGAGLNSNYGVHLGKYADGGFTRNALDLHLDLENKSHVFLSVSIRDFYEENNEQDGLFFSNDGGATFHQVYTFRAQDWCDNTWGAFPPFSVDALAESVELNFTSEFVIRFQQYDDADFSTSGDEDGFVIDNVCVVSRPPVYASLPFNDNFDNSATGQLGSNWAWAHADQTVAPLQDMVKPTAFVYLSQGEGTNNSKAVLMGKNCDDGPSVNALDLYLNLENESDVFLYFTIRDFYEETNAQDGLFFSNDGGATFRQVYAFRAQDWCDNTWGAFPPFSVDALAASVGLDLTSRFVIRFQQFDDADFSTSGDEDGFVIDDVSVVSRPPVYATLPFNDNFDNSATGQLGSNWAWSHGDSTVAPLQHVVKPTAFVYLGEGQGTNNSKAVSLGKHCDDGPSVNVLDLFLNLEDESHVFLYFTIRDFYEETNAQDGLFFSNDGGATFHQVYAFRAQDWCDNTWGAFPPFSVDALAASVGLNLTSRFVIRFQQYDDADFSTSGDEDGFIIDDVSVVSRPPVYASPPFSDNFDSSVTGQLGSSWAWSHGDSTVVPLQYVVKPTAFVYLGEGQGINNSKAVSLGKHCDDGFSVNALDLHLNLAGASDILLSYSIREFFEENHPQDGIFFSNDGGASFKQIYTFDFSSLPDNQFATPPPLNLDGLTASLGLSYSSQCIIRFQQYDDSDFSTSSDEDGYILDNINVEGMVTSTNEEPAAETFCRIYPNPVSDQLTIAFHPEAKVRSVRIINAQGRMLSAERIGDDKQAVVNVSDLPSGFYVVEVETEVGGKMLRKFVKR